jgi:hypothetical protein
MANITEHDAFARITNGLGIAIDGCKLVSEFRTDQRDLWLQLAQTLAVTQEAAFRLAGDGAVGKHRN